MYIGDFETAEGRLSYRAWGPPSAVDCFIQLHGIESHSEWFEPIGEQLARRGFATYALDRLGSGRSEGRRGDIDKGRIWVEHVHHFVAWVRAQHRPRTLHLVGSCWGGKLAVRFVLDRPGAVDSLVLLSPALRVRVDLTPWAKFAVAWALVNDPTRTFPIPIARDNLFTRDPLALEYIRMDRLRLRRVTARLLWATRVMDWANLRGIDELSLPVLTLLAHDDEIVDVPGVAGLLRRARAPRLRIEVLPEARHSLEFASPERVADAVARWLLDLGAASDAGMDTLARAATGARR